MIKELTEFEVRTTMMSLMGYSGINIADALASNKTKVQKFRKGAGISHSSKTGLVWLMRPYVYKVLNDIKKKQGEYPRVISRGTINAAIVEAEPKLWKALNHHFGTVSVGIAISDALMEIGYARGKTENGNKAERVYTFNNEEYQKRLNYERSIAERFINLHEEDEDVERM
jgi:hypothetical protein